MDKDRTAGNIKVFDEYLRRTRRRRTPERYIVLESAEAIRGHFNAEDVRQRAEAGGKRVAAATVYSTLALLVDAGILSRHVLPGTGAVFEFSTGANVHLVCTSCGRIKDVRDRALARQLATARFSAFTPSAFSLNVSGICSACARKRRRNTKENKTNSK